MDAPAVSRGIQVTCPHCTELTLRAAGDPSPSCTACGSPLPALEPTVLRCGWCRRENDRHLTDHCVSCGGPLPPLPGRDPGPRPPATPRELPAAYLRRVRLTRNPLSMIGIGFIAMSLLALPVPLALLLIIPFPVAGAAMLYLGIRRANRWLSALHVGVATRGELTAVERDLTQSIDGKHPWRISFSFELLDGGVREGHVDSWDPAHARRKAGDRVWVVYAPGDPSRNAIWPPVR